MKRFPGITRPVVTLVALVLGTGAFAALQPALAGELIGKIDAIVTCSSTAVCTGWQNNGTGAALQGVGINNNGVQGFTHGTGKIGVYGETDSTSGGYGVKGANTALNGTAVFGQGTAGVGVFAAATGTMPALRTNALAGHGGDLYSSTGVGAALTNGNNANNGVGFLLAKGFKPGAVIGGVTDGAVITAGQFGNPLSVYGFNHGGTTASGYFLVDSTGNVNYSGSLIGPSATRSGVLVTTYVTKTTQSNVEDSGTAQLVGGSAVVRLDAAYAQSIDAGTPYRVFLTPNADSHGLFVAQKTPTAFVVREMQGGHGTFSFDYRILGSALGHAMDRMSAIRPDVTARLVNPVR